MSYCLRDWGSASFGPERGSDVYHGRIEFGGLRLRLLLGPRLLVRLLGDGGFLALVNERNPVAPAERRDHLGFDGGRLFIPGASAAQMIRALVDKTLIPTVLGILGFLLGSVVRPALSDRMEVEARLAAMERQQVVQFSDMNERVKSLETAIRDSERQRLRAEDFQAFAVSVERQMRTLKAGLQRNNELIDKAVH